MGSLHPVGRVLSAPRRALGRAVGALSQGFYDLRLVWKLLVPLLLGVVVIGLIGSFLVVRTLSERAQTALDEDLFRRSVVAEAQVRDHAQYVLETARFGANLQGLAEAVQERDTARVRRLLASVPATRPQLDLLVLTDDRGRALLQIERLAGRVTVSSGAAWGSVPLVARSLGDERAAEGTGIGLQTLPSGTRLAVAVPVRLTNTAAAPLGALLAGVQVDQVARRAAEDTGGPVGLFRGPSLVGQAGSAFPPPPEGMTTSSAVRRVSDVDGQRVAVIYAPVVRDGKLLATLAVGLPTAPAFASVEGARNRLLALLGIILVGVVGFGAAINRVVLRQVRPLVSVNRALGRGELGARAPVLGGDELGELAAGLNLMAEQLQAAQAEEQVRVAARTEELARLYGELDALSAERSETFAALNHEFRNDLVVISGYAELMLDPRFDEPDPAWRREYGAAIQTSTRAALERVSEALELARSHQRSMQLALKPGLRLEDLVTQLRATVLALAGRADLAVEWDLHSTVALTADARRLREVVMNLVSNAIKYTGPGGTVMIGTRAELAEMALWVSDTGVGIPSEALDHLFEPFYRVAGTRTQRGEASSGIGLAHVKRVVEAHGGAIEVVSEPGRGSTFTVRLPTGRRRRGTAGPARAASGQDRATHGAATVR